MNTHMLAESTVKVNRGRFVSPLSEYDQGRKLYREGKPLSACVTDEMADGWLKAEAAGADAYFAAMMADASAVKCVNWNSGAEVW